MFSLCYVIIIYVGRRVSFASGPLDVPGKRGLREVHLGLRRVVFRSGFVGNIFAGKTTVLRLFQRRGEY